jgi:hypothetical protein
MRFVLSVLAALVLPSRGAVAGYDDDWYMTKFWSGEYPAGFSVTRAGTTVMGRTAMDKDLPRDVPCVLPYRAVIHPWNRARARKSRVEFHAATRIIRLVAKENFEFVGLGGQDTVRVPMKTGDAIEYIHNLGEGLFRVRVAGKEHTASQDLFKHVQDVTRDQFVEDDWAVMTCENRRRVHIFLDDLRDPADPEKFAPGIADGRAGHQGYGHSRDLTAAEAQALERERGQ